LPFVKVKETAVHYACTAGTKERFSFFATVREAAAATGLFSWRVSKTSGRLSPLTCPATDIPKAIPPMLWRSTGSFF